MTTRIDMEPGNLGSYQYGLSDELSQVIADEFNGRLQTTVADSAVQPELDTAQLLSRLHESIDQAAPEVFSTRLIHERKWDYKIQPLEELLGRLALREEDVPRLSPGEPYLADLHSQLDDYRSGLETLKTLHDLWPPETFAYLSTLDRIVKSDDENRGDEALKLVRQMTEDRGRLTLDTSSPEGLLLLAYLPHVTRQLTRRLLVGNHIVAQVGEELGVDRSPEEEVLLETLQRYYMLKTLHGDQWDLPLLPLSEASQVEIAKYSAEQLGVLATLQREADKGSGRRFKKAWRRQTGWLDEAMEEGNRHSSTTQWQLTDIGHAFGGFRDYELLKAFRYGMYSEEGIFNANMQPQKSGLKAAILEDDDVQRSLWRQTIENNTSFTSEDDLSFATPEGMNEIIDDPTVGLFLLDIQNGDDLTAGIRVGEEVLRRRRSIWIGEDASGKPRKTKIIVWSASSEAVEQAKEHFNRLIEDSMPDISSHIKGHIREGDSYAELEVRPKTWHAYRDME